MHYATGRSLMPAFQRVSRFSRRNVSRVMMREQTIYFRCRFSGRDQNRFQQNNTAQTDRGQLAVATDQYRRTTEIKINKNDRLCRNCPGIVLDEFVLSSTQPSNPVSELFKPTPIPIAFVYLRRLQHKIPSCRDLPISLASDRV